MIVEQQEQAETCNVRRFQISWCFSHCPNKPGSCCPAGWRLVIHYCNTCPIQGSPCPSSRGTCLPDQPYYQTSWEARVPWGVTGAFLRSGLNQTFAGALDPQRRTGELLQAKIILKRAVKGGIASSIVHSLPSPTVQLKKNTAKQEATSHHPRPLWLLYLWIPVPPVPIAGSLCFPYLPCP